MKKLSLVIYLLLSTFAGTVLSQDTLLLTIPERRAGISLKFNNRTLIEERSTIHVDPSGWAFRISSTQPGHKLTLINTEGNDSVQIKDLNRTYVVRNNSMTEPGQFALKSNISLKIYNQADQLIKTFQLAYKPKETGGTTTSNVGNSRTQGTLPYKPGSAVIDALSLANPNNLTALKFRILSYYANNETDLNKLKAIYSSNKFLDSLFKDVAGEGIQQSGNALLTAFSSVGGLDVTNIADALARFLVKRTKQELSAAFFERFKSTLDSIKDLQTLFPATASLLGSIDSEVYNYERYIQHLRETFIQDISALHKNFPGIIRNHPAFFIRHPQLSASLLTACYVAGELENQAHPGDILASYPLEFLDSTGEGYKVRLQSFKAAIQTVQLVSHSLRDTATGEDAQYWVNISQVRELVNNRIALKFYLGLLWQEAAYRFDSIHFEGTKTLIRQLGRLADVYDKGTTAYQAYKTYILRFGVKADALNRMIKNYKQVAVDSSMLEKYDKYFRAAIDLVEYCTAISELPVLGEIPAVQGLAEHMKPYFKIAYATADMVMDINKRNYASAINHAVNIYDEIKARPAQTELDAGFNDNNQQKPATSNALLKDRGRNPGKAEHQFQQTLELLAKYGGFMGVVATTKSSAEIEQAIEVFALPPGSSRIKRASGFNVALNAYVGLFTGYEKIKGVDKSFRLNAYGVTAPLGIAISKGHGGASSSLFMSFIDIGAVTAFRFKDDVAEKVPKIQLKDIISPGIFYSYGFAKTPLSANIGFQVGPLLRKVNLDQNLYEDKYSRFSISLCVDIPVLNFYTTSAD